MFFLSDTATTEIYPLSLPDALPIAGVHSFSATLKTAGSRSLTATDTVTSTITGTQSGVAVSPAAASSLVVSGFASPSTAGTSDDDTAAAHAPYRITSTLHLGTESFS